MERALSISFASIAINSRHQGQPEDSGWQQFAQLVRTVNAGDLPAAKKAYAKFTGSEAGDLAKANPNGRVAQTIGEIGKALGADDIVKAQQALAAMRSRARQNPLPAPVTVPSISPDTPGAVLNVTI